MGQSIAILYTQGEPKEKTLRFQTYDGENWTAILELKKGTSVEYKYCVLQNGNPFIKEWGANRHFAADSSVKNTFVQDKWRPRNNERNAFFSSAFTQAIFKREDSEQLLAKSGVKSTKGNQIIFQLHEANIRPDQKFCVIGNVPELGNWDIPLLMDDSDYPLWKASIDIESSNVHLEYKYAICDLQGKNIQSWEDGDNRVCHFVVPESRDNALILADELFRYNTGLWKGAGVAIPVFSLRSKAGLGIGEFSDLIPLVDWASKTGMNVVQILPVNDTLATMTLADSYPYAAISVFALHPLYINISKVGTFINKEDQKLLANKIKELNALEVIDFEKVLESKMYFLQKLYAQEKASLFKDKDFLNFIEKNKSWLISYGAFCYLRDLNKTCIFSSWPEYSVFAESVIQQFNTPEFHDYDKVAFWYFVQYHADKQLIEAKNYARKHQIALKGDLPIGIYRHSCDAWVAPHLYNMDEQAGAPPDDYAEDGQNWGFPTYNWQEMSKDGFAWWRGRMQKLNEYFDALRIDHILGFFRIWSIPLNQQSGTLGLFNPRLPFSGEELASYGINGNPERFVKPFVSREVLKGICGKDTEAVIKLIFDAGDNGLLYFKSAFNSQKDIINFFKKNTKYLKYEKALLKLMTEVLLITEPDSDGKFFNPRITISTTDSFKNLDHFTQTRLTNLYNDYYFKRHDQYWREQALWKLPALLDASNMLICGEDLGMIPASVPGVMRELNIISLEIQRMPKGNARFGRVSSYPYFSVCSPSCHDMSTIRGWWESDHEMAKDFYYNYLKWYGLTPMECSPEIVLSIVEDHLSSPSMMAIFPIQDLTGMDNRLRKAIASSEQINEPSNPKHYWRYRFHIDLEVLNTEDDFNNRVKSLIKKYGRINNPVL